MHKKPFMPAKKKKMFPGFDNKGYTLIEMVLVLAIAAFLLSIIVPRFMQDSVDAKIAKTRAGLEKLRTALVLYYAKEGKGRYPSGELSTALGPYLDDIPADGFHEDNAVYNVDEFEFTNPCRTPHGGWCYCYEKQGAVIPNLPDNDQAYGHEIFSLY